MTIPQVVLTLNGSSFTNFVKHSNSVAAINCAIAKSPKGHVPDGSFCWCSAIFSLYHHRHPMRWLLYYFTQNQHKIHLILSCVLYFNYIARLTTCESEPCNRRFRSSSERISCHGGKQADGAKPLDTANLDKIIFFHIFRVFLKAFWQDKLTEKLVGDKIFVFKYFILVISQYMLCCERYNFR